MTETTTMIDSKGLREFGIVTGAISAPLFGLLLPWLFNYGFPLWPWILGAVLALWGLVFPTGLRPVYKIWMKIGHALGWVNTRIILGLVFYIMISPMGMLMRLFGKDPMNREYDVNADSYRIESKEYSKNHLERPF